MGLFFLESLIYRNPQWEKLFIFHRVRLNESWHLIYHSCGGHKSGLPLNWEVENWEEKEKKFEAETPTHKTWKVKFSTMASTTALSEEIVFHTNTKISWLLQPKNSLIWPKSLWWKPWKTKPWKMYNILIKCPKTGVMIPILKSTWQIDFKILLMTSTQCAKMHKMSKV